MDVRIAFVVLFCMAVIYIGIICESAPVSNQANGGGGSNDNSNGGKEKGKSTPLPLTKSNKGQKKSVVNDGPLKVYGFSNPGLQG